MKLVTETESADYVPLMQAAGLFPGRAHQATLWRWATHGVSRNGRRVVLQTLRCGRLLYTCQAWAEEFLKACSGRPTTPQEAPSAVSTTDAERRTKLAGAALKARGVGRREP